MEQQEQVGRRERKKQEVLRRIQESAAELFRDKGYEATTVEEIAERADIAKGTFFNYFPRKEAVLTSLSERQFEDFMEEQGAPEQWKGTAKQQFQRLYLALGEIAEQNAELSRIMVVEHMRGLWLEADPREQQFHGLTCGILSRGRERGEFTEAFDLRIAARLLEATYFTTLVDWLRRGAPPGVFRREVSEKLEIVFRGLGASGLKREGGAL